VSKIHEAGGGFHIYGNSRDGKTTAALVALSVWGQPESLKMAWKGTGYGFDNIALASNDNLLVLDEIGQAKAHVVSDTAYSVLDGKSKIQGAKEGGNREITDWRILLFSTGEYALDAYMNRHGKEWEAGQAVRLPSIAAGKQYGIYETLHGFPTGAALSDYLLDHMAQQHGTAGRAWLAKIQSLAPETIAAEIKKHIPKFKIAYDVDPVRQGIADSWPNSLDDSCAKKEWGWKPKYTLESMTKDMLQKLSEKLDIPLPDTAESGRGKARTKTAAKAVKRGIGRTAKRAAAKLRPRRVSYIKTCNLSL